MLPLYFPRDKHEEEVALLKLPADVGDENGETTIDERKIRIKPLPNAKKSSPRVPQASVDLSVSNVGLTRLVMNSASTLYYTYKSHVGDIREVLKLVKVPKLTSLLAPSHFWVFLFGARMTLIEKDLVYWITKKLLLYLTNNST